MSLYSRQPSSQAIKVATYIQSSDSFRKYLRYRRAHYVFTPWAGA